MSASPGLDVTRRAEQVRDRLLLSSIIGREVKLSRAGNEYDGLCPFHHDTKIGSFKVNDKKQIYKCFACGANGDHFKYLMERKGWSFLQALTELEQGAGIDFRDAKALARYDRAREKREIEAVEDSERRRRKAAGLWLFAHKLQGTPAQLYLEGRGIDFARLGRFPGALRYRLAWNSELRREIPTIVAAMIDPLADPKKRHAATHRTYIELVGGRWVKARLDQPKMILGDFKGAHIPLMKGAGGKALADSDPDCIPRISEGIEDGLSVALGDPARRVLAAATLGNIGALHLPAQIRALDLIEQNDDETRTLRAMQARARGDAAEAQRQMDALEKIEAAKARNIVAHQEAGRRVLRTWPDAGFKDFNDQLNGLRMEGAGV